MKLAIVGSRKRLDRLSVEAFVGVLPHDTVVVSGGAAGPDTWAVEAATARGLETIVFLPDLTDVTSRGVAARRYHDRNQLIVEAADAVVAFVVPERKGGTEDTIRRAERRGIPVTLR